MPHSATPRDHHAIAPPSRPRHSTLPHALTFFLTTAQRRAVLAALRRHDRGRESALLRALGIATEPVTGTGEATPSVHQPGPSPRAPGGPASMTVPDTPFRHAASPA